MSTLNAELSAALTSEGRLPRAAVRDWVRRADDLRDLALLYRLTDVAWHRIEPALESAETCTLIRTYLLRCIQEDPQDPSLLTQYEAAGLLEAWFDHLSSVSEDTTAILKESAEAITEAFLRGNEKVQRAIEQGFLEHVLEQVKFRPLFEQWANDDRLRGAWEAAIAWGDGHPNFMKSLRASPRKVGAE
jgi:hypothetical protein